jgi:hypothetical protein
MTRMVRLRSTPRMVVRRERLPRRGGLVARRGKLVTERRDLVTERRDLVTERDVPPGGPVGWPRGTPPSPSRVRLRIAAGSAPGSRTLRHPDHRSRPARNDGRPPSPGPVRSMPRYASCIGRNFMNTNPLEDRILDYESPIVATRRSGRTWWKRFLWVSIVLVLAYVLLQIVVAQFFFFDWF